MQIFPHLVWSYIVQFLQYQDICHLRSASRWLATLPNKKPLSHWLARNDPICLNLGLGITRFRLKYGLPVNPELICSDDEKLLYIGGNVQNFVNYAGHNNLVRFYLHTAYKKNNISISRDIILLKGLAKATKIGFEEGARFLIAKINMNNHALMWSCSKYRNIFPNAIRNLSPEFVKSFAVLMGKPTLNHQIVKIVRNGEISILKKLLALL